MNTQTNISKSGRYGAETEAYRQSRSPLWRMVFDTVRDYRLSNMTDADDPNMAYPLVDLMSNPGPATIATGEHEMALLTDEIVTALLAQARTAGGPQIGPELVPGSSTLLKRIGDRISFFGTEIVTTPEYLVIQRACGLPRRRLAGRSTICPSSCAARGRW